MELAVFILATWRLSSLLAQETGPADVFARLRLALGVWYDEGGEPHGHNVAAQAVTCIWCVSVWVGAAFALAWYLWPAVAFWLAVPFALSTGAVIVDGVVQWHERQH